jgi:signal transduction histidine kinase/ligand-binding sensor domain-containing protein/DNA-binding response OmpR family regulator
MNRIVKYKLTLLIFSIFMALPLLSQEPVLKFDHLTVNNGMPQNSVYSAVKDKYGFMWFSTWGGAVRYNGYNVKVFRANENDTNALTDNRINFIVTDSLQNIWIQVGDSRYVYRYNYENDNFDRVTIEHTPVNVKRQFRRRNPAYLLSVQNSRYIWSYDHKILYQTDKLTGKSLSYTINANNPFSLTDNIINCMVLDESDDLWIGTQSGGVCHSNVNNSYFTYYNSDDSGSGLIENVVRTVCKDSKGRVWVGSESSGVTQIISSPAGRKFNCFDEKRFQNARIRYIYADKQGVVWIGTKGGLTRFDENTATFKNCSSRICDPNIFAILEDNSENFWVGTFKGLMLYNRKTDEFTCFGEKVDCGRRIRTLYEDHLHRIWITTEDAGVTCMEYHKADKNPFRCIRYSHREGDDYSLANNRTFSLVEDNDGKIWVATNSGLSRIDPKTGLVRNFTMKTGLVDDIIMGVLFDGKDHIWFSHKKGLTRMDIHTFDIRNFNMFDGLQGYEFNQNACFRDAVTGEMFFGGTNGLNSFFPDSIKINRIKPTVVLTGLVVMNQPAEPGISINNQVILKKALLCTSQILLNWWNRSFSIEFAALHYANPLGNKYRYKLEGYDKQWINTDASNRVASYSRIPSGTYTFKVYGANSDGYWSLQPAVLTIKILPPWWFTWWAWVLYLLLAFILVYFISRYVSGKIELRKNEEIHNAKMQFFTEISHEFRTPLTLIIDPLEKLNSGEQDPQTIKKYYSLMLRNARQLLLLINQLLDFRKLEAGKLSLNKENSDFVIFIKAAASAFEARAKEKNIRFYLNFEVEKLEFSFDPTKLNMVINNLLSNAFKYTPNGGTVGITLKSDGTHVCIKVNDNGTGISQEEQSRIFEIFYQSPQNNTNKQGSGIGLALTRELVMLHGGTITVESEMGQGSCFVVILPLIDSTQIKSGKSESILSESQPKITEPLASHTGNEFGGKPLVLMVDDNADIREYAGINLKPDFRLEFAEDGSKGYQIARELLPDIIISDVMMPVMDGIEMCRLLKSDERTSHIPVILLTARQSDEAKTEGYETGADAYITKPFNSKVLFARISNLLEQRRRLREFFSNGSALELKKIAVNKTDEDFIKKVIKLIEENLEDEDFDIDLLAEKLTMSRSQFYRKIKALTNKTLLEFVTTIRMNKALEYLVSGAYNISETAYKVGFSQPTNFTRTFTRHFGTSPSNYLDGLKNN